MCQCVNKYHDNTIAELLEEWACALETSLDYPPLLNDLDRAQTLVAMLFEMAEDYAE